MTQPDYTIELRVGDKHITVSAGVPHVVGRGQTDGLGIDDPQVSFRHLIVWFDQVWQVWNEGRNGSFVNGQPIQGLAVSGPLTINLSGPQGPAVTLTPAAAPAAAAPPAAAPPAAWPQQQGWGDQHQAWGEQQQGWGEQQQGWGEQQQGWGDQQGWGQQQQGWGQQQAWGQPQPWGQQQQGWDQQQAGGEQQDWGEAQAYQSGSLPAAPEPAAEPAAQVPAPSQPHPQPHPQPQAAPIAPPAVASDFNASAYHPVAQGKVTVGRAPDNTIVLDTDLLVSRHHAELAWDGQYWVLTDLESANGTYVDGRRITSERIWPTSLIGIGHQTYRLYNGTLVEFTDTGSVTFEARELYVITEEGRKILDNVSFVLEPNSMLVIVGPSGSGKSTLLKALTGTQPASYGQVGYGGRDLYSNYDEIRHRIGFVPQDDILHPQLRVVEALDFAGRLRFPLDVGPEQRQQRVQEVIAELGLQNQAEQRVSTLSGGQRKRTSTAMELLTRPSLLFLDEPTSGLDINRDREVMTVLRKLCDGGRTVIVVSHNVAYLGLADRILVLATGGQLAYYGPPDEALQYFGFTDYADMYAALEQPRTDWRETYEKSPIAVEAASKRRAPIEGRSATPVDLGYTRNQTAGQQFKTLCARYLKVVAADRAFVVLTVVMPIVLALFAHLVPGSQGMSIIHAAQSKPFHSPAQLLLVLIVGGCLMGTASAVREIVKERPIYEREKGIGLSWAAYLASKVVVLSGVVAVQALFLVLLGTAGSPGPDVGNTFEIMLAVIFVTISSMCIGLLLSALVANADRVMPLMVLVIMAQLLLSGGLFQIKGTAVLEQLSWLMPARWAFAAGAGAVGFEASVPTPFGTIPPVAGDGKGQFPNHDGLWESGTGHIFLALFMLILLTGAYVAVTAVLLRRIGQLKLPAHLQAQAGYGQSYQQPGPQQLPGGYQQQPGYQQVPAAYEQQAPQGQGYPPQQ